MAVTDRNGRARLAFDTDFSEGYMNFGVRVFRHLNYEEDVLVRADGYGETRIRLSDHTRDPAYDYRPAPPAIMIRITKR